MNNKLNNKRVIKTPVPKEIWDAHMSFCNMFMNKDILGTWMDSVTKAIKDSNSKIKI